MKQMNENKVITYLLYPQHTMNDKNGNFVLKNMTDSAYDGSLSWFIGLINSKSLSIISVYRKYIIQPLFFISPNQKNRLEEVYIRIQSFKNTFRKLIKICKTKYSKRYNDLNTLYESFGSDPLQLLENSFTYTFDRFEVYKIVHNSFNYSEQDIPIFTDIKNPYTNKPFSYHNKYNIYFYLMRQGRIPRLFYLYINENMNMRAMLPLYQQDIFIQCLKRQYSDMNIPRKIYHIDSMIKYMDMSKFLDIQDDIKIMHFEKICLNYYIFINLLFNDFDMIHATRKYKVTFVHYMSRFNKKNNKFGRTMYRREINTNNLIEYIMNDIVPI